VAVEDFVVKYFPARPARRLREFAQRLVGRNAAAAEWDALQALSRAGVDVPQPLARGLAGATPWVAMTRSPGTTALERWRSADAHERRALAEALGRALARVHAAGWCHGDLHLGNVLVDAHGGVEIVDWQRGRPGASARDADIASLDFSLAHAGARRSERLRLRRAALGVPVDGV